MSVSFGEVIATILFLILAILHCYYWFAEHVYEDDPTIKGIEHAARAFGLVSMFFVMFVFFTVTRISLWVECFGLSFEHLIALHRLFGGLALLAGYLHGILFFIWFSSGVCVSICSIHTTHVFVFICCFLVFSFLLSFFYTWEDTFMPKK